MNKIKNYIISDWKTIAGIVIVVLFFYWNYLFLNNSIHFNKQEKEYQKQIKLLNDSIVKIDKLRVLNTDTIYIAEKEANKQDSIAKDINQKTNEIRNKIPKNLKEISTLDADSSAKLFNILTEEYRQSLK